LANLECGTVEGAVKKVNIFPDGCANRDDDEEDCCREEKEDADEVNSAGHWY